MRVLHVHHAPPPRQARPPRPPSGCRRRCIARMRPKPCTLSACAPPTMRAAIGATDLMRAACDANVLFGWHLGLKASSCVCCTFTTLHHRAKHVHHALREAAAAAASLARAEGHTLRSCAPPTVRAAMAGAIDLLQERCINAPGRSFRGHQPLQCCSGCPRRPAPGPSAVPAHLWPRGTMA